MSDYHVGRLNFTSMQFCLLVCILALSIDGCTYGNIGKLTRRHRQLEACVGQLEARVVELERTRDGN